MKGYNRIILMGNLVREPEVRYTGDNRPMASFTVAVNRMFKDAGGQSQEEVTYFPIVAWGYLAEFCQDHCHKGDGVLVEGRVTMRSYETISGEKRHITEVIAGGIQFVGNSPRQQVHKDASYIQDKRQDPNIKNRYTAQELAQKAPVGDFALPF